MRRRSLLLLRFLYIQTPDKPLERPVDVKTSFREVFRYFREVFRRFRTCLDLYLLIRMHSDARGEKFLSKKKKMNFSFFIFENFAKFFDVFGRFRGSWRQTDLKISSGIKFCSRYTYPEVRATQNREKMTRTWPPRAP